MDISDEHRHRIIYFQQVDQNGTVEIWKSYLTRVGMGTSALLGGIIVCWTPSLYQEFFNDLVFSFEVSVVLFILPPSFGVLESLGFGTGSFISLMDCEK